MALVLTLYPHQSVYVGETQVLLFRIVSEDHLVLRVGDTLFDVVGEKMAELLPGVMFSVGRPRMLDGVKLGGAQLAIKAPRSIPIVRGWMKHAQANATGAKGSKIVPPPRPPVQRS